MADSQINVRIVGSSSGAEQALDRVAKKAENALGKDVTASMEAVKSKAQKIFGIEIPSIMNAAKSGAAFGAAAIGIEAAGRAMKDMAVSAVQTTDQLTQIRARINLINDGSQSTAEIMDKIYSAANRSRGSYLDMADSVAKLNMLAKDAFSNLPHPGILPWYLLQNPLLRHSLPKTNLRFLLLHQEHHLCYCA